MGLKDAFGALWGDIRKTQNFGDKDSMILSTVAHPLDALHHFDGWLNKNIRVASGLLGSLVLDKNKGKQ